MPRFPLLLEAVFCHLAYTCFRYPILCENAARQFSPYQWLTLSYELKSLSKGGGGQSTRDEVTDPWRRARSGELKLFTGVDDPYEPPLTPEITVHPGRMSAPECALVIIEELAQRGILRHAEGRE